ncbi:MAG: CHASE2 domain-containing protein [Magnetococcales bacterium]|nr:CHASE2 domain-containing protein [Magnetococcales bacterium]NGZ06101.1 CHASE2 domain-containing protein [Magnetococcales bacterium]
MIHIPPHLPRLFTWLWIALVIGCDHTWLLQNLERRVYDYGLRALQRPVDDRVVLVAVDDATLDRLGPWPLPAHALLSLLELLARGPARMIGFTFPIMVNSSEYATLGERFQTAGNVILAAPATLSTPGASIQTQPVQCPVIPGLSPDPWRDLTNLPSPATLRWPPMELANKAHGVGIDLLPLDPDRVFRSLPVALSCQQQTLPSLALAMSLTATTTAPGNRNSQRHGAELRPYFHPGFQEQPEFATYSLLALLDGQIHADRFRGRLVLIGPTTPRLIAPLPTPTGRAMTPVELHAQALSTLLNRQGFHIPEWAHTARYGAYGAIALLLLTLPRNRTGMRLTLLLTTALLALLLPILHIWLLDTQNVWLPLFGPWLLLATGSMATLFSGRQDNPYPTRPLRPRSPEPTTPSSATPTRDHIGGYPILAELARDDLGTLLLGQTQKNGQPLILRLPGPHRHPDPVTAEQARNAFLEDAKRLITIRHEGVVTLRQVCLHADPPHLVLDPFPISGNLERHVHPDDPLPLPVILYIITRAALTLDALHRQGITHGNLRPEELIYDPKNRQVRIKEFGLARLLGTDPSGTGLSPYAAPETLMDHTHDPRSDLYALGATLFHLLTGHPPFRADHPEALRHNILNTPPTPVRALRPEIPETLANIIATALEKSPSARFQSGNNLARELIRFIRTQVDTPK